MKFHYIILTIFLAPLLQAADSRPNVLFIAVDDLRPELGCYGVDYMRTPNMDRLAATGTIFDRAFCNVAVCGASRASLMSGIRPTPDRFVTHRARQDQQAPEVPGLAEYFKENGYYTVSNGKIYHFKDDTPESWSEPAWNSGITHTTYLLPENQLLAKDDQRGPPYEAAEVPDNAYPDGIVADKAVNDLHRLRQLDQPFFLAVGFIRPHLPFNAPKTYWDLYDRESIKQPANHFFPLNAPDEARYEWGELRRYEFMPATGPITDPEIRISLRHGYYAATSYADALVGKLIDTLERLGLADDTIVVLWGDHGWQLGEHAFWCKHTNFDVAVRVPLIIRDPRKPAGQRVSSLVEHLDIYPTLCQLAGLELPGHLQGKSMAPLLENPEAPGKSAVFSRYGDGESIRTDRYRYTAFIEDGEWVSDMLYDLLADPSENINIVDMPIMENIAASLREQLQEHIAQRE
jgi:arylsulfatase A-like enzyme